MLVENLQYIFDDFNDAFLSEKLWNFMNMGSPGNLKYILQGDGFIILEEKNLNHDGHGLVSKAYLDSDYSSISAGIAEYEYGAGIGYYGGDGCWDKYITFAVLEGHLEVKVSSGAQNGDAFMHDGQEKYYYFYKSETVVSLPLELKIERQGNSYKFYYNGQFITECSYKGISGDARAIVKSMGSNTFGDTLPPSEARIDFVRLEGLAPVGSVSGTVLNEEGMGIGGASVHIAGHEQFFVAADKDGRYSIENIPRGRIRLVAAAEKYLFNNVETNTEAGKENFYDIILKKESEENIPRPEYNRPDFNRSEVWCSLNGTWSFDFDRADTGEAEEWFAPGKHKFSKCIKVPFSWSSLEGFGEEFYVDGRTLHEANPFFCNYEITGENGWYKKSITVPADFPQERNTILKIGACSAVTKVWCDGQLAGIGINQYGQLEFCLGRLEPGTEHVLIIKVQFPYDKNAINLGKQLFWFNQCPGIWQTVWLEPRNDFYIKTIHATPQLTFSEGKCLNAAVEAEITCESEICGTVYPVETAKFVGMELESNIPYYSGRGYIANWSKKNQFIEFEVNAEETGLYQIAIRYSAGAGDTERLISINGNTAAEKLKFLCTPGYDTWQYTKTIVKLDSGLNLLRLFIAPEADSIRSVSIDSMSMSLLPANVKVSVSISDCTGKHIAEKRGILELTPDGNSLGKKFVVPIPDPKLWDTENPNLYYLNTCLEDEFSGQGIKDNVKTYFGLRKIEAAWAPGHCPSKTDDKQEQYKYLYLNGKPFYMLGILDQGYNPWGIYTYRAYGSDTLRGSIKFDINHAKSFGYNTIRMHIKENEPLWYYYCDVAGVVVWNEHPGNEFAVPDNPVWDGMYRRQLANMLDRTYNNPSILLFSTINESWGIEGCQLSSPWKNPFRQQWQKSMAILAKHIDETRLICDNSGFGKTGATDITDYHMYPDNYEDAKRIWKDLSEKTYPGSAYNFYNTENGQGFAGGEVQDGQPLILSEFNHTNGIDVLTRMYPKIAGYVRMNIASQEFEDTSPLTAERYIRDFGYMNRYFEDVGYGFVNQLDCIIIDKNRIEAVRAGELFSADIYLSHMSQKEYKAVELNWKLAGIESFGEMVDWVISGKRAVGYPGFGVQKEEPISFRIPNEFKGGYLFVWLKSDGKEFCENYIGLEINGSQYSCHEADKLVFQLKPSEYTKKSWDEYDGVFAAGDRSAVWGRDKGFYEYELELGYGLDPEKLQNGRIIFEAAARKHANAVNMACENCTGAELQVYINKSAIGTVYPEDDPLNEKALFTHATLSNGKYLYKNQGNLGYGYRYELQIPADVLNEIKQNQRLHIRFEAAKGGMTLYGSRVGRYGINPLVVFEYHT